MRKLCETASRETVDFTEQMKCMAVCEKRIGEYIPPTMAEKEPTPEELEEMRKKEARKDRLHQNYLKRKANGKQKEYEERTKGRKKAQIESQKKQIRAEDSQHRAEGTCKADDDC